jgi:hypothetical protein
MDSLPPSWGDEMKGLPPSVVVESVHAPHLYRDVRLPMWVLYDHPADLPNYFVLRLWDAMTNKPHPYIFVADTLNAIEQEIDAVPGRFHRLSRYEADDPKILATYL